MHIEIHCPINLKVKLTTIQEASGSNWAWDHGSFSALLPFVRGIHLSPVTHTPPPSSPPPSPSPTHPPRIRKFANAAMTVPIRLYHQVIVPYHEISLLTVSFLEIYQKSGMTTLKVDQLVRSCTSGEWITIYSSSHDMKSVVPERGVASRD